MFILHQLQPEKPSTDWHCQQIKTYKLLVHVYAGWLGTTTECTHNGSPQRLSSITRTIRHNGQLQKLHPAPWRPCVFQPAHISPNLSISGLSLDKDGSFSAVKQKPSVCGSLDNWNNYLFFFFFMMKKILHILQNLQDSLFLKLIAKTLSMEEKETMSYNTKSIEAEVPSKDNTSSWNINWRQIHYKAPHHQHPTLLSLWLFHVRL